MEEKSSRAVSILPGEGTMIDREKEKAFMMARPAQCPFVEADFDDCYCKSTHSQNVPRVVHYCMRHFEKCGIYKKLLEERSETYLSYFGVAGLRKSKEG